LAENSIIEKKKEFWREKKKKVLLGGIGFCDLGRWEGTG